MLELALDWWAVFHRSPKSDNKKGRKEIERKYWMSIINQLTPFVHPAQAQQ